MPESSFRVDRFPKVSEQIKSLAEKAKQAGTLRRFTEALKDVLLLLQSKPLEWGDPLYSTKKAGGVVRRGILAPVIVHFAVYEQERVVQIIDIQPMSGSELAV